MLAALARAHAEDVSSGYIDATMGSGKTYAVALDARDFLANRALEFALEHPGERPPRGRILVLCHDSDILDQTRGSFTKVLESRSHGNIHSGTVEDEADVVYATFQSMNSGKDGGKRYEAFDPEEFDYIVVDEAHHGPAETYRPVIQHFKPAFLVGLTGTPDRADEQDIADIFGPALYRLPLQEAIAKGYVVKPDYRILTDHVRTLEELGENLETLSLEQLNNEIFVRLSEEEIVSTVHRHLAERREKTGREPRTVVFCNSIDYAEEMAPRFQGRVATFHSGMSDKEAANRLRQFKAGELDMLLTVNKFNEGLHIPEAEVFVFLRDTSSRTVFMQQFGRGLATHEGKEDALYLDFVATWERMDMILDLIGDILAQYKHLRRPSAGPEPFQFTFSEEALKAVEVIKTTKERRAAGGPVQLVPDYVKEMALVENMLHAKIPRPMRPLQAANLIHQAMRGDQEAKYRFVAGYYTQIHRLARAAAKGNPELTQDYFQEGVAGVVERIGTYVPGKTESPKAFANRLAREAIRNSLSHSFFKLSIDAQENLKKVDQATEALQRKLGREPTEEEIAEQAKIGIDESAKLRQREDAQYPEALDTIRDLPATDGLLSDIAVRVNEEQILRESLEMLSYRERRVLELLYGLGNQPTHTLEEAGRVLNVTRERIRQIKNQAIKKLGVSTRPRLRPEYAERED